FSFSAFRFLRLRHPARSTLFPYTTLFRSNDTYAFIRGDAPDTANPSLWRQSTLNAIQGLFEVVPGIYQVRGFDLSNVTFIEGERSEEHTSELQSRENLVCRLLLEKKKCY